MIAFPRRSCHPRQSRPGVSRGCRDDCFRVDFFSAGDKYAGSILKDAVGFLPSSLIHKFLIPSFSQLNLLETPASIQRNELYPYIPDHSLAAMARIAIESVPLS